MENLEPIQLEGSSAIHLASAENAVMVATLDQPESRVNTLSRATLQDFSRLLDYLERQPNISGLILRSGKPGMFIAGADIKELGSPNVSSENVSRLVAQGLDIVSRLERLPFPTVAAIDGPCLGGGLEFALGFDYRIASTNLKTELGCPEVKIGLIPGWGGTQRLPRVIGPALAAEVICTGDPMKARRAAEVGLVSDIVAPDHLLGAAVDLLQWGNHSQDWREQRLRKQQPVGLSEEQASFLFAVARAQVLAKTKPETPAASKALDVIARGCNLPLDMGLKIESEAFIPLVGSPVSRNLIAVFFMTQRLQKDTGVSDTTIEPRPIQRVGVLGAGLMGSGIAAAYIGRGIPVMLYDSFPQALEKGVGTITSALQRRVDSGRMAPAEMTSALGRLSAVQSPAAMTDRDLVIEAIIENEEAKTKVFRELQHILPPTALVASNTSTISISRLAKAASRPENFAGMHFFNPVERMPLVEVIRGDATSDATVVTLVALAKRIDKTPIVVRDCPGFLVNRILFTYLNESLVLLEEGAEPRALDRAATAFGMPMGPITLNDVVGLDTSLFAGRVIREAFPQRATSGRILQELVDAGRLGQKSGAGFYSYARGARGTDDPAFTAILERCRTVHRQLTQEEITDRLFLPMVVEASLILEEGVVRDPADVDMGMILGTGFPTFRGGLLRWADSIGLAKLLQMLKRYESLGPRYHPTAQMQRLAKTGKGFYTER